MNVRGTLILLIVLVGCGGNDVNADEMPMCETGWPFEEGGDDYGAPWDVPEIEPDMPPPKLDVGTDLVDAEDISTQTNELLISDGWELAPDGDLLFRNVTPTEAEVHGWDPDANLIIAPEFNRALRDEAVRVQLTLPLGSDLVDIVFTRRGDTPPIVVIDRQQSARDASPRRSGRYAFYASTSLPGGTYVVQHDDILARLVADHDGGVSLLGVGWSTSFRLRGPITPIELDIPPPPDLSASAIYMLHTEAVTEPALFNLAVPSAASETGEVLDFADYQQCSDGWDNDGDDLGDECDFECQEHEDYAGPPNVIPLRVLEHTKSFGMFGDLLYCSQDFANSWETDLAAIGMETAQFLNWVDGGTPDTNPPFRAVMIGCDVQPHNVAQNCHSYNDCPPNLADYPLNGASNDFANRYIPGTWNTVDWYVEGREAVPMHAAVIATSQNGPGEAGRSFFSFLQEKEGDHTMQGAAVVNVSGGAPSIRVAHELGHAMGQPHDLGQYIAIPDVVVYRGFMNDGGGSVPYLGPFDNEMGMATWWGETQFQVPLDPSTVWAFYVSGKRWPRPSGFGYTGDTP